MPSGETLERADIQDRAGLPHLRRRVLETFRVRCADLAVGDHDVDIIALVQSMAAFYLEYLAQPTDVLRARRAMPIEFQITQPYARQASELPVFYGREIRDLIHDH